METDTEIPTYSFYYLESNSKVTPYVPPHFRDWQWPDFICETGQAPAIVDALQQYEKGCLQGQTRPLLLYGDPGGGKTAASAVLFRNIGIYIPPRDDRSYEYANTLDNFAWVDCAKLPDLFKAKGHKLNHIRSAKLVVLDDIDKCPGGGWSTALHDLINERLCKRPSITVVSMNTSPREFQIKHGEYGRPMWDRFVRTNAVVVKLATVKKLGYQETPQG